MYPHDGPWRVQHVELRFLFQTHTGTRHAALGEIQATGLLVRSFNLHDVRGAVMKIQVLFHLVIILGGFHRTQYSCGEKH